MYSSSHFDTVWNGFTQANRMGWWFHSWGGDFILGYKVPA